MLQNKKKAVLMIAASMDSVGLIHLGLLVFVLPDSKEIRVRLLTVCILSNMYYQSQVLAMILAPIPDVDFEFELFKLGRMFYIIGVLFVLKTW